MSDALVRAHEIGLLFFCFRVDCKAGAWLAREHAKLAGKKKRVYRKAVISERELNMKGLSEIH